jgi:hypothetical protein
MEISWVIEVIHRDKFEFWVPNNVLGKKEYTYNMHQYKKENG